jgi:hypothetical protein
MAGDGGVIIRYLDEGITIAVILNLLVLLRGNPRSRSPGSDDGSVFGVALPLGSTDFGAGTGR